MHDWFSANDKRFPKPVICETESSFPNNLATHIHIDKGSMAYYDLILLYKNVTLGKTLTQIYQSEETIEKDRALP